MWILPQLSIQGFPLDSFFILLGAFWALAFYLTRGSGERAEGRTEAAPNVVRPPILRRAEPQPAAAERKLAA